jgi:magnesium transporter
LIRAYTIDHGALRAAAADDAAALRAVHWIDLADPTPAEIEAVEKALGVEIDGIAEPESFPVSDPLQSADTYLSVGALLLGPLDTQRVALIPITLFRTKGPLVTLTKRGPEGLGWLIKECKDVGSTEAKDAFPMLLDMIIDHATNALDKIGGDLDKLNRILFQHHATQKRRLMLDLSPRARNRQLDLILTGLGFSREILVKLRRSVLSFRRVIALLQERGAKNGLAEKLGRFEHELREIAEAQSDLSATAGFMLDGAVGFIGILQNKTVNILTLVGTLLTPPVLVASVYGMNFKNIPELQWEWGYFYALGLMVISAVAMYVFVRVRGWL